MDQSTVFTGMNGFTWWVGVVENRNDPLSLARCQIRVFGWHTEDKNLIPTADLPWALPILPVNNSKTFNTPVEGDWVIGFFFDGPLGQVPVYFGVFPGIPNPSYVNNPQKGFSDPRSSSQLARSPTYPKTVQISSDGSGAVITNQPAQRNPNPSTIGYPSTNLLAINDPNNPPATIAQRYLDVSQGIPGPEAKNLNTEIAAAAQGAAAAVQTAPTDLKSLLPSTDSLSKGLEMSGTSLNSLLGGALNLTSGLVGNDSAAQAKVTEAKNKLAQRNVDAEFKTALKASEEQRKKALESASQSLGDLQKNAGNIAKDISNKLSGLSPGDISTKTPVIVSVGDTSGTSQSADAFEKSLYKNTPNEKLVYTGKDSVIWDRSNRERLRRGLPGLETLGYPRPPDDPPKAVSTTPNADLGAVAPSTKVNVYAPNPIPDKVPLDKVGSTLDASTENTVTLYKETVTKAYDSILNLLNTATTKAELDSKLSQILPIWSRMIGRTGEVADAVEDPNIKKELDDFIAPLRAQLNTARDAAYARVRR
jgi:hypothetical protein